jgi:hypothetical protein
MTKIRSRKQPLERRYGLSDLEVPAEVKGRVTSRTLCSNCKALRHPGDYVPGSDEIVV